MGRGRFPLEGARHGDCFRPRGTELPRGALTQCVNDPAATFPPLLRMFFFRILRPARRTRAVSLPRTCK